MTEMKKFAARFISDQILQWLGNTADCLKVRLHKKLMNSTEVQNPWRIAHEENG